MAAVLSQSWVVVEVPDGAGGVLDLIELGLLPTPHVALRCGFGD